MKAANRLNATWTVIMGEEELTRKQALVRHMVNGQQEEVPLDGLNDWLLQQKYTSCQEMKE